MITANDAIATARSLLCTPYSQLDCINLIKRVIRTAPGGVPGYTTAGTNTLWRSATASEKYRDLTYTQEGIAVARAGMLAFKRKGTDVHHVGLVTGEGTVIHSSSARGCVVETALNDSWQLLAVHRYIEVNPSVSSADTSHDEGRQEGSTGGGESMAKETALYRAQVVTKSDPLTLRDSPGGARIGKLPKGVIVDVLAETDGWMRVRYGGLVGWASRAYLARIFEEDSVELDGETVAQAVEATRLVREDGDGQVTLIGRWRVAGE